MPFTYRTHSVNRCCTTSLCPELTPEPKRPLHDVEMALIVPTQAPSIRQLISLICVAVCKSVLLEEVASKKRLRRVL